MKMEGFLIHPTSLVLSSTFQLGTLGAGNHYAEIQVVDEIFNEFNARKMGIEEVGQVLTILLHSPSLPSFCKFFKNIFLLIYSCFLYIFIFSLLNEVC